LQPADGSSAAAQTAPDIRGFSSDSAALRADATGRDPSRALPTGIEALDALLPEGGLPRGAVTELSVHHGLGLSTFVALRSLASAQVLARTRGGQSALVAYLDPGASLHGPGARALGVDLERILVIQPPTAELARVATRVVSSRVFAAVVIDTVGVLGAEVGSVLATWSTAVRRVALAAEGSDTAVMLLTDRASARPLPLPVALRLELDQTGPDKLLVRVAKERRGHLREPLELSVARTIPSISPLSILAREDRKVG
jgi:RecA/RadA recombinase